MKQPDPIQTAARHIQREKRLGVRATCLICGETNLAALRRAPRSLFEEHHVVGKANARDLTVVVCLNCHRKATEGLEASGVSMDEPRDLLERLVMIFRGLAEFLRMLADSLVTWASQLE